MWKSISVIVTFVAVMAASSYAAWDGSKKTPKTVTQNDTLFYEITSPEELVGFLEDVRAEEDMDKVHAYLKNDIVFGADTSKLCEKVFDFENAKYLQSTFDGRGHFIYGINAVHPLFKIIGQGEGRVINLNIVNSSFGNDTVYSAASVAEQNYGIVENVNVYNTKVRGYSDAGGIVANAYLKMKYPNVYILNCNMIGGTVEATFRVGGIVAYAGVPVMGCTNSATVRYVYSDLVKTSIVTTTYVGGIVAYFGGSERGLDVSHCINRGSIELTEATEGAFIGGIAGMGVSHLENVLNEGNITVNVPADKDVDSSYIYVGGIAGMIEFPQARDLLNKGKITATMDKKLAYGRLQVGGIAGRTEVFGFSNALNLGSVEGAGFAAVQDVYVGGIAGYSKYTYKEPSFSKLKNRASVSAVGTFSVYAGGLIGQIEDISNPGPVFRESFNYGDVTAVIPDTASAAETLDVGGIAGAATNVILSDVYNRGNLVAKGKVANGSSYVGGIAGFYSYPATNIENSYSATPVMEGDVVGGIVGYLHDGGVPANVYFDASLVDVEGYGKNYFENETCPNCKKNSTFMKGDEVVDVLNTANRTSENRNLWVKRGDYPVLSFDSLYKNDSVFFDVGPVETMPKRVLGDTVVYTISTPKQLEFFLTMAAFFNMEDEKEIKIELANDIVMGRDTTHLSMRKLTTDVTYCVRLNFEGNGHTIYGLNMDRAMLNGLTSTSIFQNVTIANSRFENDEGLSAAAVVLENAGCVRNVIVRNSLVRGGESAGGLVARSVLVSQESAVLDSKNENTTVISNGLSGGIIANDFCGVIEGNSNSGRVVGRIVGGIVGTKYGQSRWTKGSLNDNSNSGLVLASGRDSVMAGGIVGKIRFVDINDNFNTGLIEAVSDSGKLYVGGIAAKSDSVKIYNSGNWGRIHAESQNGVYAGGVVGAFKSETVRGDFNTVSKTSSIFNSYNYGPLHVKSSNDSAIVGGIAGFVNGGSLQGIYNRGSIMNDGTSQNRFTGGLVAITDSVNISHSYSYVDTLSGSAVGNIAYELQHKNVTENVFYGSNTGVLDAVVHVPSNPDVERVSVVAKTFDEMKYASLAELLDYSDFVDKGCLPVIKNDTTSACAEKVIADEFGESEKPFVVGYLDDFILADGTEGGEGGTVAVEPNYVLNLLPSMHVAVSGRSISVMGLPENHAVAVFDLRGRKVASARMHEAVVRLAVPRTGRYIVRSGSLARIVTVR